MSNGARPAGAASGGGAGDLNIEQGGPNQRFRQLNDAGLDDKVLISEAQEGTRREHSLGLIQGLKTYKRAAFWSVLISCTIIMEGYDVALLGSFFGYPQFRLKYGEYLNEEKGYQISSGWQQAFNISSAVANILGALLNGYFTAKYGHRKVIMLSLAALAGFIFIVFFAPNIQTQLAGQILCNIPWGVFATTGPAYASEVTPLAIRGHLTAYVNLCWCIGQFIGAGVLAGLVSREDEWSYKIPFAIQWMWPVPLFVAAWLAPESPWHLVRINRLDDARRSLERLSDPAEHPNLDETLAMMVQTNKMEMEEREGVTYWDAFRGTNLRRTEIACVGFLSQITTGGALCYQGTFFFQQTGIPDRTAYYIGLAGTAIAFLGTCLSWAFIYKLGRRRIWLIGLSGLVAILWTIGFLALPEQNLPLAWAQSLLCVVWLGVYSMTVGPIVYTLIAEIGSTRLRTQTIVLARSTYYAGNIIGNGTLNPKMISPGDWNLKGKTAFFWAGVATLTLVWGYFRVFETKGRTFGELDTMFQRGVTARQSANYKLEGDDMAMIKSKTNESAPEAAESKQQ
ncbi:hypothetical protein RB594_005646 [Gaeumannomyces avenae]